MSEIPSGFSAELPKTAIEELYDEFDGLMETVRFCFITKDLTKNLNEHHDTAVYHRINMMRYLISEVNRLLRENQTVEDRGQKVFDIFEGILSRYGVIYNDLFGDCDECGNVLTEPESFIPKIEQVVEESDLNLNPGRDISEIIMAEVDKLLLHAFDHVRKPI